jgi:phenylacetate-CoA ligase
VVKKAYENVPYYRKRLDDAGVTPEDIQTLKDIERLPFTTKSDLRDAYPFGMFAVNTDDIVEVHTTLEPQVNQPCQDTLLKTWKYGEK